MQGLLEQLRDCANAPPVMNIDNQGKDPNHHHQPDHNYLKALDCLQKSDIWKGNAKVRNWLATTWLPVSQVLYILCNIVYFVMIVLNIVYTGTMYFVVQHHYS